MGRACLPIITAHDFFSTRIGGQTYQPLYGMDLAALCRRGEP
jgi:hypothetical protein